MKPNSFGLLLLRKPALVLPSLTQCVAVVGGATRRRFGARSLPRAANLLWADQEKKWYFERGNWAIDVAVHQGVEAALSYFEDLFMCADKALDTYSCAQRLVNFIYLSKLSSDSVSLERLSKHVVNDAVLVAENYEFKRENLFFNNHLLNNLRALLLTVHFLDKSKVPDQIQNSVEAVEAIILEHSRILFESVEVPLLDEGSVSYELLILRTALDICCAAPDRRLSLLWRPWFKCEFRDYLEKYRSDDRWLIPSFGDLTPDWSVLAMDDFLSTFASDNAPSVYRTIWASQLESIGI